MITMTSAAPLTPLTKAAKSLEAVFLRQMIASMRAPALADDPFGSSSATQFRDMSDAKLADSMAGSFGVADMVEKQMKAQPTIGRVA
jgi:flagellar protein FlgJ